MPVAEYPALSHGLRPNSYAGALFACNFQRAKAYELVRHLHIHSTLRKDEWESLDRVVVEAGREVLVGVQDLRGAPGLLRTESIGVSIAQYNKMSSMPPANLAMNPLTDGERGRIDFSLAGVPIPFAFEDFQLDIRTLTASRTLGSSLDLQQGAEASYQVALAWETLLFNGTPAMAVADRVGTLSTIYGYKTHPDRNTGSVVGDWASVTAGYINAINSIELMKASLRNDKFPGPYWLYLSSQQWADVNTVNANTDRRVSDVIRADPEISLMRMSHRLTDGEVILVDPRPRVVQWVEGAMIRPVEWDEKGGLGTNYRIIGAGAPLVKSDYIGQCGVAHFTGA